METKYYGILYFQRRMKKSTRMMESVFLQKCKVAHQAREAEENRVSTRRRNLLVLIFHYLESQGYLQSAQSLQDEATINMDQYRLCDNVDLELILQEYETFQYVKFCKLPLLVKKLTDGEVCANINVKKLFNRPREAMRCVSAGLPQRRPAQMILTSKNHRSTNKGFQNQNAAVLEMSPLEKESPNGNSIQALHEDPSNPDIRLLRPLGAFPQYSNEWHQLAEVISKDIYLENPDVHWDDIIGLSTAKKLIKEAVVYPIKYPDLFSGILAPWKGLLLYGPPGSGKTMLAKAVATECKTTFFNISATTIVSKWRGDSEKLVRVLFELARFHAPSTIFLDELDSVMSHRGGLGNGEHEASRRMKTELLVQMDGLARSDDLVFVLAASNMPWELDHAALRRLEKRILVPLPSNEGRRAMFWKFLPPVTQQTQPNDGKPLFLTAELDYNVLADHTDGYSGADIKLVCKEAAMNAVRKVFDVLESHKQDGPLPSLALEPIETDSVLAAISRTKPSNRGLSEKYVQWQQEYESS